MIWEFTFLYSLKMFWMSVPPPLYACLDIHVTDLYSTDHGNLHICGILGCSVCLTYWLTNLIIYVLLSLFKYCYMNQRWVLTKKTKRKMVSLVVRTYYESSNLCIKTYILDSYFFLQCYMYPHTRNRIDYHMLNYP